MESLKLLLCSSSYFTFLLFFSLNMLNWKTIFFNTVLCKNTKRESFYLFRPNFLSLRSCNIQCKNAQNNILIALVNLVNTNAITLFASRFLTRPNFEQIRSWNGSMELFSLFSWKDISPVIDFCKIMRVKNYHFGHFDQFGTISARYNSRY